MKHSVMKQGNPPYKGHKAMVCDVQRSEHGTGTDAGRSKTTEGKRMESPTGSKGPHGKGVRKGAGY